MTTCCPIRKAAECFPAAVALRSADRQVTYQSLDKLLNRQLLSLALPQSDFVLLPVSKSINSIINLFSLIRAGRVPVPVDAALPSARLRELARAFDLAICDANSGKSSGNPEHRVQFAPGQAVLGIFTSGSSGSPKLVLHAYQSLLCSAQASNQLIPLQENDCTLLSLPLYHIGGIAQILRAILSGTEVVVDGVVEDPHILHKYRISHTSMVATQLQRLLGRTFDSVHLKAVLLGGGPSEKALLKTASLKGLPLWPTYGMTETASQLVTESPAGKQTTLAGAQLSLAETGEILVRGENLFLGYRYPNDPELHTGRDSRGWFHTRDLGQWRKGKLHITGRLDNQFISGGKNIQPEEIEGFLLAQPDIRQAFVVPVRHPEFGLAPFAFIRQENTELGNAYKDQLIARLKALAPGYLVPRHYAVLPDSKGLKYNRAQLAELAGKLLENH